MKRILRISLALSLLAIAPVMLAQDAAAPFRRATPTPAPEDTPASEPAESPREQQREEEEEPPRRAEPATTPTAARAEQPPAATPAAEAAKQTPAPAAKSSRRVLQGDPVRAVEPRPPGSRRPRPPEPQDDPERRESEPPKERERDEEPERREAARPPKPPERDDREDARDRPPAPVAQANRGATLDYWDDDPGSAVKALERKWQKALVDKDVETIDKLLARDFVATSSTGRVGSKSTVLNTIRRDKNEYRSANARNMSVRMLGPRVAVVTGIATESGTTPDGRSFRNSRRFTDTWMLRSGRWVCVASQATELPNG